MSQVVSSIVHERMILFLFLTLLHLNLFASHEIHLVNSCPTPIWVGTLGNFGQDHPENGGFRLDEGTSRIFRVPHGWGGRIWGRTKCDEQSGYCETGDCGSVIECDGASGLPPMTLVDIAFDGFLDLDYYYVTLVDGYNLQVDIKPIVDTVEQDDPSNPYNCQPAGCIADLNQMCPDELALRSSSDDSLVVGCKSACHVFNTDEYCCRGEFDRPETCQSGTWPVNYPAIFKSACPLAYSYIFDQSVRTFTCKSVSQDSSSYEITFC